MIKIEAFPASYGESILVTLGNDKKMNILIDSGFASTYRDYIKDRLQLLSNDNQKLDLFVLTHFDADHIRGGIELFKENSTYEDSNIIKIEEVWMNMLRHIEFENLNIELSDKEKRALKSIARKKYPEELYTRYIKDISSTESISLSKLVSDGGYKINKSFDNKVIMTNKENNVINLDIGVKVTLLSPNEQKVNILKEFWKKELLTIGLKDKICNNEEFSEAFEKFLVNVIPHMRNAILKNCSKKKDIIESIMEQDIFDEDSDEVNGSSIAFILEYENKRIMFLGDCHPSVIEKELKKMGFDENNKIKIDLMKISHHGSKGNTSRDLLKIIDCNKFLICTNGKRFNHPDKEVLARIIANKTNEKKEIFINYRTLTIEPFLNEELMKKYNYSIIYGEKSKSICIEI